MGPGLDFPVCLFPKTSRQSFKTIPAVVQRYRFESWTFGGFRGWLLDPANKLKGTWMYLWWSLCSLHLHACQVSISVGDSGLCCCACVMTFKCKLTPLCVEVEGKSENWVNTTLRGLGPGYMGQRTWSMQHSEVWVLGKWARELGQETQHSKVWVLGYMGQRTGSAQHSEVWVMGTWVRKLGQQTQHSEYPGVHRSSAGSTLRGLGPGVHNSRAGSTQTGS